MSIARGVTIYSMLRRSEIVSPLRSFESWTCSCHINHLVPTALRHEALRIRRRFPGAIIDRALL
jgi:hypothetical protein